MWNSTESNEAPGAVTKRQLSPADGGPRTESRAAYISPSMRIEGEIEGRGDIVVDGRVQGSIKLGEHSVTVGANGEVEASVEAREVIVHGVLKGVVSGCDRIQISKTGTVEGEVAAGRIAVEDGAVFRGKIEIVRQDRPAASKPSMKAETAAPAAPSESAQKRKSA